MKYIFKHSLLILMAVAVLASSTGVTVFKMVCGHSGKEIVSLKEIKGCCKNNKQESESIEKKCCDFSSQTFKVSLLEKTEFKTDFLALPSTNFVFAFSQRPLSSSLNTLWYYNDTSPPKTGRTILCLISTFLI